jgi:hypothetical protein
MPKPYDLRAWRRLSRYKLQAQPLCELCLRAGKIEPSNVGRSYRGPRRWWRAIAGDRWLDVDVHQLPQHETRGRHPRVRRRWHAARPIASVVCAVMSSKNDNVMLAIEMSYLTSGQQSVYNAFLLD